MTDHNPLVLASMLALGSPDLGGGGCPAWVDSIDHQCDKPRKEGFLCARHHTVAVRRWEATPRPRPVACAAAGMGRSPSTFGRGHARDAIERSTATSTPQQT